MTATYTPIASVTLSANASEVSFPSLPQTFRDLILVIDGTATVDPSIVRLIFNGDTATGSYTRVIGYGVSNGSRISEATNPERFFDYYAARPNLAIAHLMDYSATNKHKTVISRWQGTLSYVVFSANRWANTNAITSMNVLPVSASFVTGTTLSLFGIAS